MSSPDRLTVARWLVEERRFSVIPLEPHGKKPIAKWSAFQEARPGLANLEQWFGEPDRDLNLGIVCGQISDVVVVDCDSAEAIAWAEGHLPETPMRTKTAKGQHWFFRHPGVTVRNQVRVNTNGASLQLDVRGDGGYVVAPTSVHESGAVYERLGSWPLASELPPFDRRWIDEPDTTTAADPEPLSPDDGPIPAGQRNAYLARQAGALRRVGATLIEIERALLVMNEARCRPALHDAEVRRIAASVHRYPPANGARSVEPASPLECITLAAMLGKPEEEYRWLVHERLAVDSVNLLLGRPKSGKSTLARGLALAVARGTPWLGFTTRPGGVFYVALENMETEVTRHFRQMGADGHEDLEFFFGRAPADILDRLRARLDLRHVDLVIVDTLQRLLGVKDSNDYAEVSKAFDPVIEIARTHHVCLVLLHHAGKMNRGSASDNSLGSTAYASSVDNVLELVKADRCHYLHSDQRIGVNLEQTVVTLDPQTGQVEAGGSKTEYERQLAADAMQAAIRAAGVDGIERADLFEAVEMRRELMLSTLKWLIKNDQVQRLGKGLRGSPYRYSVIGSGNHGNHRNQQ